MVRGSVDGVAVIVVILLRKALEVLQGPGDLSRDWWRSGDSAALSTEAVFVSNVADADGDSVVTGELVGALGDLGLLVRDTGVLQVTSLLHSDTVGCLVAESIAEL